MFIKDNFISLLAFIAASFFMATAIIMHFLRPDLGIIADALSKYALGKHGILLEAGFVAIGVSQLILGWLVLKHFSPVKLVSGGLFLLLAGVGVLIVAVFPMQPPDAALVDRLPHILGAVMQFLFFPIATLCFAPMMVSGQMRVYTYYTGFATAILFVIVLILFVLKHRIEIPVFGLIEKIDIAIITLWNMIAAYNWYRPSYLTYLFDIHRE